MKVFFFLILSLSTFASELRIDAIEISLGKFHRYGNRQHTYSSQHAFKSFILPDESKDIKTVSVKNSSNHYSIFFTNLADLFQEMLLISKNENKKIHLFNLSAHGAPGGLLIPRDSDRMKSVECYAWKKYALMSDEEIFTEYYKLVSFDSLKAYEEMSRAEHAPLFRCISGHNDWVIAISQVPELKNHFTNNAQIHFISCLVGMGKLGDLFTKKILQETFINPKDQRVLAAIELGLGDWSMSQGMGFWTFQNEEQYKYDFENYPLRKEDLHFSQRGNIKAAEFSSGELNIGIIKDADLLILTEDQRPIN